MKIIFLEYPKIVSLFLFCLFSSFSFAQNPIVLEAEKAELHGDLKVKYNVGLSNGAYIGDHHIKAKSYLRFLDVYVEKTGTYEFKVFYMGGSGRSLYIKVNNYVRTIVTPTVSTPWDTPPTGLISTYIYLDAGKNTITMGPHNDDGPNLDKFEIVQTTHVIAKPELEKIIYAYDLTDDAKSIIGKNPNETFNYLTDNDINTKYSIPGVTSTTIEANFENPVVISGYILAGIQSGVTPKLEYSKDKRIWMTLTPGTTTDLGGGFSYSFDRKAASVKGYAAKYYRLTLTGTTDLSVSEWQMFGIPYLDNVDGKSFPKDITEGINWSESGMADPEGNTSLNESFRSLFNRNVNNKYYTNQQKGFFVTFDLDTALNISHYTLTSCDDNPSRDPKNWILNAYNEEEGWLEVDLKQDFKFPFGLSCMKFSIDSEKKFTKFLLDVTDNQVHGTEVQLLKWQTFEKPNSSSKVHSSKIDKQIKVFSKGGKIVLENNKSIGSDYEVFNSIGELVTKGHLKQGIEYISATKGMNLLRLNVNGLYSTAKVLVN